MEKQAPQAPRVDQVMPDDKDRRVNGASADQTDSRERTALQVSLVTPEDPDHKDQLETEANKEPSDLQDNLVQTDSP